jgi:hypothetical protein
VIIATIHHYTPATINALFWAWVLMAYGVMLHRAAK